MGFQLIPISTTLDDRNAPPYSTPYRFSRARCVAHIVSGKKILPAARYISCLNSEGESVTPCLDFKVTIFFNVKYLENGTRQIAILTMAY